MATRTAKLGSVSPAAATWTPVVVVPVNTTYIVKSAVVLNFGGAADTVYVGVVDGAARAVHMIDASVVAAGAVLSWDGWVVIAPGDTLRVYAQNGTAFFWLSGAKLPGVA